MKPWEKRWQVSLCLLREQVVGEAKVGFSVRQGYNNYLIYHVDLLLAQVPLNTS